MSTAGAALRTTDQSTKKEITITNLLADIIRTISEQHLKEPDHGLKKSHANTTLSSMLGTPSSK